MPTELREQGPVMKELLLAMGICVMEKAGLEADDILGTRRSDHHHNGCLQHQKNPPQGTVDTNLVIRIFQFPCRL